MSRSAAWTLFFLPPVQRLHRPAHRGRAHGRAAQRGHPHPQLVQGGIGLLAQASRQLGSGGRIQGRRGPAAVGQSGQRTARTLAPPPLSHERNRNAELARYCANGAARLRTRRRDSFAQIKRISFHPGKTIPKLYTILKTALN
jgi:hypothetical protein